MIYWIKRLICPANNKQWGEQGILLFEKAPWAPPVPCLLVVYMFGTDLHSKKKSTSEHLFWCFRLSQIEDSIQYLEGPNSTWKDLDRNLGVRLDTVLIPPGPQDSYQGPSRYWIESSICGNLKHKKGALKYFFLRVCGTDSWAPAKWDNINGLLIWHQRFLLPVQPHFQQM